MTVPWHHLLYSARDAERLLLQQDTGKQNFLAVIFKYSTGEGWICSLLRKSKHAHSFWSFLSSQLARQMKAVKDMIALAIPQK